MWEILTIMKYYLLLYGVCAVITLAAVLLTSLIKVCVCAAFKKGGGLSGTAKEYVFTPIALLSAAAGVFWWLTQGLKLTDVEFIVLCTGAFSVATMFFYWLIFQPTRKLAVKLITIISERVRLKELAETLKEVASGKDLTQEDLQSIAKTDEKTEEISQSALSADEAFHNAINALKG